jgi:hypothetical protein
LIRLKLLVWRKTGERKFNRKGAEVEEGRKNLRLMYSSCARTEGSLVVYIPSRCVIAHISVFSPGRALVSRQHLNCGFILLTWAHFLRRQFGNAAKNRAIRLYLLPATL